jgi:FAD:protein FMN transferase
MGCEVVVGGATEDELDAIVRLFDERDRLFSRFRRDSELSRVNRARGDVVAVSHELSRAVGASLEAAARTRGLFDPTVGGPVRAQPAGRWRSISVVPCLLRRPPGLVLDLNGVVESMAVDDAAALLSGPGFVSAGGDLAANAPVVVGLPGGGAVRVGRGGLATSGTRRRRLPGGEEQHRLIDPRTGLPSRSPWLEVTVAASTCLAADVAAKAAFLLGDGGPDWLEERGLAGRFHAEGRIVENGAWCDALAEAAHA